MNRKHYRKIAKKYKVGIKAVKEDMQEAINHVNKLSHLHSGYSQGKGEAISVDEFIRCTVDKVKTLSNEYSKYK